MEKELANFTQLTEFADKLLSSLEGNNYGFYCLDTLLENDVSPKTELEDLAQNNTEKSVAISTPKELLLNVDKLDFESNEIIFIDEYSTSHHLDVKASNQIFFLDSTQIKNGAILTSEIVITNEELHNTKLQELPNIHVDEPNLDSDEVIYIKEYSFSAEKCKDSLTKTPPKEKTTSISFLHELPEGELDNIFKSIEQPPAKKMKLDHNYFTMPNSHSEQSFVTQPPIQQPPPTFFKIPITRNSSTKTSQPVIQAYPTRIPHGSSTTGMPVRRNHYWKKKSHSKKLGSDPKEKNEKITGSTRKRKRKQRFRLEGTHFDQKEIYEPAKILITLKKYHEQSLNAVLEEINDLKLKRGDEPEKISNQMSYESDIRKIIELIVTSATSLSRLSHSKSKGAKLCAIRLFIKKYHIDTSLRNEYGSIDAEIVTFDRIKHCHPYLTTQFYFNKRANLRFCTLDSLAPVSIDNPSHAILSKCLPALLPAKWSNVQNMLLLCLLIAILYDRNVHSNNRRYTSLKYLWHCVQKSHRSKLVREDERVEAMVEFEMANKERNGFDDKYLVIRAQVINKIESIQAIEPKLRNILNEL